MRLSTTCLIAFAPVIVLAAWLTAKITEAAAQQPAPKTEVQPGPVIRTAPPDRERARRVPRDDTMYLWNKPTEDFQSVLTVQPQDNSVVVEVGFVTSLTPVRVEGLEVVPGREEAAKKAFADLAVGKLMTASLTGRDGDGAKGDFWTGEKTGWLSDQMLKTGHWQRRRLTPLPAAPRGTP